LKKEAKTFGFGRDAFLLDLDGTLIDIAPTPDAVKVAPFMLDNLRVLRDRCGGALAIITGRSLREVDMLLGDIPTAVAAEHGTVLRHAPGEAPVMHATSDAPADWLAHAERLAVANPGVILERKRHGFVLHYRGAPSAGAAIERALRTILDGLPGFTLLAAKMAWEVRPAGVDKGFAVRAIMSRAPFARRLPVFVGDDITDEDGIKAAVSLGGVGFRVDEMFGDPAGVRAWIADLAQQP